MITRSFVFRLGLVSLVWANALDITNVNVDWANQTVTFTIQWQNAWRVNYPPNNWDAAWVFIKFRACNSLADPWTHGLISTTGHTFPSGIEPVLSDGSGTGIDPSPNNTGVMLRPANSGTYATFGPYTVTLKVTNLPTSGSYDLKVLGIEMVYIPQGSYLLGTLNGYYNSSSEAAYAFDTNGNSNNPHIPYTISSEASFAIKWAGIGSNPPVTLPAAYPKGFKAFHCMKYEISQGQYAMFLNTLPSSVQSVRFPGSVGSYRNQLTFGGSYPNTYYSTRPDRAQGYLSFRDVLAYLDWACLRPMTELEFEKICRGPGPSAGEYAWGTTNIIAGTTLSAPENGTEVFTAPTNANATYNNVTYSGGDGGQGPVRVGIHAKPNSPSREASGAAFYGVLDMSGNVYELCVRASSSDGAAFDGQWGDGNLSSSGDPDVSSWPTVYAGLIYRGGSWANSAFYLRVSSRWGVTWNYSPNNRGNNTGGRGVR